MMVSCSRYLSCDYLSAFFSPGGQGEKVEEDVSIYVAPALDEHSLYSQFSKIKIQTLNRHAIRYYPIRYLISCR